MLSGWTSRSRIESYGTRDSSLLSFDEAFQDSRTRGEVSRLRRGLIGLVNGVRIPALADTGAA